jgi:FAD:protein FMN transferase
MELYRFPFMAMASSNEVQLYADHAEDAGRMAQAAIAEVRRIEAKYSRYREDTVVAQINHGAGAVPVMVDAETKALLDYADACFRQSGGRFDITSGVLRQAWNFRAGVVPTREQLVAVLPLIGWQKVQWRAPRFYLPRQGMEIDFGGIGKEYAADRASAACADAGARHGLVNLGGDVRVIGPHPDGRPWLIGIRHPRSEGETIASIAISSGALATSGDYERFFERDGVRYCHILNPRTGLPVQRWQSVTVIAPLCIAAGSYCTIAMLLEDGARAFLTGERLPYLLVDRNGQIEGPLEARIEGSATRVETTMTDLTA